MEWQIVSVIVVLVGLGATVTAPLMKFSNSITKLSAAADRLEERLNDLTGRNSKAHDVLFGTQRNHEERLDNHEKRITVIEHKPPV